MQVCKMPETQQEKNLISVRNLSHTLNNVRKSQAKCVSILPHLMKRQVTGLPLSRLKSLRRCTARFVNTVVKPKRLQDLVKSVTQLHRRVFLGFLKGTFWLLSYKYLQDQDNSFHPFDMEFDMDNGTFSPRPSDCILEFWLYHPNRPIELKFVRNLFTDLDKCLISYPEELKFAVYQWIEKPNHILAFGERVFIADSVSGDRGSLLSITYLPVPRPAVSTTCPMCLKSKSMSTYSCVFHDCLLDFFGSVEDYHQTKAEKHLRIPNTMYLNISGQKLYCVSMSHSSLNDWDYCKDRYGNLVTNIRTTVYSGDTTSNSYEVNGVSDVCDDFTMNCTTTDGQYYLPLHATECQEEPVEDKDNTCLIVRRSWLDLQLLIIDEVYPLMCEKTAWFNSNCVLKDWTAEYIEICAETGTAICEMTFKVGEDPRFFDTLDQHICSVTFIWEVKTGHAEISKFDEGILIHDEKPQQGGCESTLVKRAKNPLWVSKLSNKHRQPPTDRSVIELNNIPYIKGESLAKLVSVDRTAVITL